MKWCIKSYIGNKFRFNRLSIIRLIYSKDSHLLLIAHTHLFLCYCILYVETRQLKISNCIALYYVRCRLNFSSSIIQMKCQYGATVIAITKNQTNTTLLVLYRTCIIYVRYRIFETEKFEIVLLFEKPITFLYNLTGTTVKIKRNKHVYFYKIDWYLFSQLIYCFTIYICEPLYITTILSFH